MCVCDCFCVWDTSYICGTKATEQWIKDIISIVWISYTFIQWTCSDCTLYRVWVNQLFIHGRCDFEALESTAIVMCVRVWSTQCTHTHTHIHGMAYILLQIQNVVVRINERITNECDPKKRDEVNERKIFYFNIYLD